MKQGLKSLFGCGDRCCVFNFSIEHKRRQKEKQICTNDCYLTALEIEKLPWKLESEFSCDRENCARF